MKTQVKSLRHKYICITFLLSLNKEKAPGLSEYLFDINLSQIFSGLFWMLFEFSAAEKTSSVIFLDMNTQLLFIFWFVDNVNQAARHHITKER